MRKAEFKDLRHLERGGVSSNGDGRSINGMCKRAGSKLSRKAGKSLLGGMPVGIVTKAYENIAKSKR